MAKVRYRTWEDNNGNVYRATWLVIDWDELVKFDSNGNIIVEIDEESPPPNKAKSK